MTSGQANLLTSGHRLRVLPAGLTRHQIEVTRAEGAYVSQFESPVHGRMVVVRLVGHGAYGFTLDELEAA